ncbi:MAG TPA: cyclic nucleotide-binding domain-containing protein [Polyangiaceae bacterium]|nr:cyclic nucleotide-binding domain-containing protein [Polyangiaceae bacterium]
MALHDNVRFYAATDVGRVRTLNEDNYLIDRKLGLFVVADGMGGHAAGEIASALAVRTIHEEVRRERALLERLDAADRPHGSSLASAREVLQLLEHAVQRASAVVHAEAVADQTKRGMGTTVSAMLLVGNVGFIAHVGDSRVYLVRGGKAHQVTDDHTVYNELIKRGRLTRDQIERVAQKNAIVRAVGVYERVEVDTLVIETVPGDSFLICSDGLHAYFASADEMVPFLTAEEADKADRGALGLVNLANDRGGKDNITAVVIRVGAGTSADEARARRLALKREVLSHMPLFARLSERELLRVMQIADVRAAAPAEVVIREGDRGEELYIVLEGRLRITRGGVVLNNFGPGDHVGEMALIRNATRSATVVSEGASELIVIRRRDFFEILRKEHELAVKLLWQFLGVLADRLDQTSKDLRSAREELALEDVSDAIFPEVDEPDPGPPRPQPAR